MRPYFYRTPSANEPAPANQARYLRGLFSAGMTNLHITQCLLQIREQIINMLYTH